MISHKIITYLNSYKRNLASKETMDENEFRDYIASLSEEEFNKYIQDVTALVENDIDEMLAEERPNEVKDAAKSYKQLQSIQKKVVKDVDKYRDKKLNDEGEVTKDDFPEDNIDAENEIYNYNKLIDLPSDLGKLNKEHEEINKLAKPVFKKYIIDQFIANVHYVRNFKKDYSNIRQVEKFTIDCLKNQPDPKRIATILSKTNKPTGNDSKPEDLEIDPQTGKTYRQLKKEIFIDCMNKVNYCKQYFSVSRTEQELIEFNKAMSSELFFCSELQGDNVYLLVNHFGLGEDQEVMDIAKNISKQSAMIVGATNSNALLSVYADNLYKYGEVKDLAYLGSVHGDQNVNELLNHYNKDEIVVDVNEKYDFLQGIDAIFGGTATVNFPEVNKFNTHSNGAISYTVQSENAVCALEYFLNNNFKDKLENVQFEIDGKKVGVNEAKLDDIEIDNGRGIDQSNEKSVNAYKLARFVASKAIDEKDVIVRDKNGKFLMNMKSSGTLMGVPDRGKQKSIEIGKITVFAEKYVKANHLDKKAARAFLNEKVNMEIKDRLGEWIKSLQNLNKPKLDAKDSPMFGAVQDILTEIKDGDMKDKTKIAQGLASARTFIQGYLDETVGVKNDKDFLKRQNEMNSIYMCLLNVEEEFELQRKFEKSFDFDLTKENEVKDYMNELNSYLGSSSKNEMVEDFREILNDLMTVQANPKELYTGIKSANTFGKSFVDSLKESKKEADLMQAEKLEYVLGELEKMGHKYGAAIGEEKEETIDNKKQIFEKGNDPTVNKEEKIDTNVKKKKDVVLENEISTSMK